MDTIIHCGDPAPVFSLPDLNGQVFRLEDERGRPVILNFWSCECPWSERADLALLEASAGWGERVVIWTIASNVNETDETIQIESSRRNLAHVLRDSQARVADLYGAQTTPHLFVIGANGVLRYQGALDDVTFRRRTPSQAYLQQAVDSLLSGAQPDPDQTPPYGCTIVRHSMQGEL